MPVVKGPKGVAQEMYKFKKGKLHSGSPKGPIVKNPKQAVAIALSEAGMSNKQMQKSAHGSGPYSDAEMKQGYKKLGTYNPATDPTGPTSDTTSPNPRTKIPQERE